MKHDKYDAVIIGGGFFGCSLATYLRRKLDRVLVLEMNQDFLQRASYVNQARIHNGYHYPRHFLTAVRSHVNFPRFVSEYEECVCKSFKKYYAIGSHFSKTTARQFKAFIERTGAPISAAPPTISNLFNPDLVEAVFEVEEYAFDAVVLKELALARMSAAGVEFERGVEVTRLGPADPGIAVDWKGSDGTGHLRADRLFNCTYSHLNQPLAASGLPIIPLKHEITEMCLVELPDELKEISVTVMCGPFFSFMPFPPRGLNTLSHVRYTPHAYWYDQPDEPYVSPYDVLASYDKKTAYPAMIRDVSRFMPALAGCTYRDSLWEVKTTLPVSERDDGRPILFRQDQGLKGLTCIMGGKIDNIYDVYNEIDPLMKGMNA